MLTIKSPDQLRGIDENKIKAVISSIEMEVLKVKQLSNDKHCSLPTNYNTLNQSEKDELSLIISRGGYTIRQVTDTGQGRTWKRIEWK